jgi:hypothetical protein
MEWSVTAEGDSGAPRSQGGTRMRSIIQWFGAVFCILASAVGPAWAVDPALPYGINAHLPSGAMLDRVVAAGIA